MSVMAHCNGGKTALAAAETGVDSIEHGAYLHSDALAAMRDHQVVWVPTLSTIGNLLGKGRFREDAVKAILECALSNVAAFREMGGLLAPGTDAGAWAVEHGCCSEEAWLAKAGVTDRDLQRGIAVIKEKF
jgi:imidazolonepropionase-like amidohydrolase